MINVCSKCGGSLEAGFTTAYGLIGGATTEGDVPRLWFVVQGMPTSMNPITAFQQGLAGEQSNRIYGIRGFRCAQCGALELYAEESAD